MVGGASVEEGMAEVWRRNVDEDVVNFCALVLVEEGFGLVNDGVGLTR